MSKLSVAILPAACGFVMPALANQDLSRQLEAVCNHLISDCGYDERHLDCVASVRSQLSGDLRNDLAYAQCFSVSSCDSIAAGYPDACVARVDAQ